MSKNKKILLSLSEELLRDLDLLTAQAGASRTDLIRHAVSAYVKEAKQAQLRGQLAQGYRQMGAINLSLAEMCFEADTAAWESNEEKLAESES